MYVSVRRKGNPAVENERLESLQKPVQNMPDRRISSVDHVLNVPIFVQFESIGSLQRFCVASRAITRLRNPALPGQHREIYLK